MAGLRSWALVLGAVATLLLLWLVNPWFVVPDTVRPIVTVAFWAAAIALSVVLYLEARAEPESDEIQIEGPAFARFLFNNSAAGLVWLPIRIFVGFEWLEAGWHKATGAGWLDGGSALLGYWNVAAAVPQQGKAPITYEWYRTFIQTLVDAHAQGWFAYLVTFGEIAVGIGLIVGALTGIAAFFGAFMNMSYLLAGSASTNPIMFTLSVGLILAWKVAGFYGVDRWLLPRLGTPWRPGVVFQRRTRPAPG
ncbi:MAG TPA: DoxX family membrane protein [Candidatus Limnocylindrales bacterium]